MRVAPENSGNNGGNKIKLSGIESVMGIGRLCMLYAVIENRKRNMDSMQVYTWQE